MQSTIHLEVECIPRSVNQEADFITRLIDTDPWQINTAVFLFLEDRWRPQSVDCFSTYHKHKLPKLFSRFLNPNSADADFLFQSLRGENRLLVPPVSINIIPRVLHYKKSQFPVCTLVVPFGLPLNTGDWLSKKSRYLIAHNMHLGKEALAHKGNALLIYMTMAQSRIYFLALT